MARALYRWIWSDPLRQVGADRRAQGTRTLVGTVIMAAVGAISALRAVPLARTASARSSCAPALAAPRCCAVGGASTAPAPKLGGASFLSTGAVGLSAGFSAGAIRASRAPAVRRGVVASAVVNAADAESKDAGKTLRIASYIFGWYFLNAVFGACARARSSRSTRESPPKPSRGASNATELVPRAPRGESRPFLLARVETLDRPTDAGA